MQLTAIARLMPLTVAALFPAQPLAQPAAAGADFDAATPRWELLDFSASKFLLTATTRIEARLRPADEIAGELRSTPEGHPVRPGAQVLELLYRMKGFGRESQTTLWVDPLTGGTLQRTQLDTGSRARLRTYRFTDVGAYHYTRWPSARPEQGLPPEQWTHVEEGMRPYSPGAVGKPVTEATALLWLIAAADLSEPGDHLEVLTFSRRHVSRVAVDVTGRRSLAADFMEEGPAGSRRRDGKMKALVLRLRGSPLDESADEEDFELLGLTGDLELLLDPRSRAPLQLRGRVRIAGQVTVRLRRLVLR